MIFLTWVFDYLGKAIMSIESTRMLHLGVLRLLFSTEVNYYGFSVTWMVVLVSRSHKLLYLNLSLFDLATIRLT
jgi:hypothetical protein